MSSLSEMIVYGGSENFLLRELPVDVCAESCTIIRASVGRQDRMGPEVLFLQVNPVDSQGIVDCEISGRRRYEGFVYEAGVSNRAELAGRKATLYTRGREVIGLVPNSSSL